VPVIAELAVGDILLERSHGTFKHNMISLGQWFSSPFRTSAGKNKTIHAAIYVGDGDIVESTGEGVLRKKLGQERNNYKVYSLREGGEIPQLAATGAIDFAELFAFTKGNGSAHRWGDYDAMKATKAAFKRHRSASSLASAERRIRSYIEDAWSNDRNRRERAQKVFCSQLVVLVYKIASLMQSNNPHYVLPMDHEKTTPADLARYFEELQGRSRWLRRGGDLVG
jgi:hypothetical protein